MSPIRGSVFDAYGTLFDVPATHVRLLMDAYLSLAPFPEVTAALEPAPAGPGRSCRTARRRC